MLQYKSSLDVRTYFLYEGSSGSAAGAFCNTVIRLDRAEKDLQYGISMSRTSFCLCGIGSLLNDKQAYNTSTGAWEGREILRKRKSASSL